MHKDLLKIYEECKESGWDGYDADPITMETIELADRFYNLLPSDLLQQDGISFCGDPHGMLTLEFYAGHGVLSISFEYYNPGFSKLHYAAMFGDESHCGDVPFEGDIPDILLYMTKKWHKGMIELSSNP